MCQLGRILDLGRHTVHTSKHSREHYLGFCIFSKVLVVLHHTGSVGAPDVLQDNNGFQSTSPSFCDHIHAQKVGPSNMQFLLHWINNLIVRTWIKVFPLPKGTLETKIGDSNRKQYLRVLVCHNLNLFSVVLGVGKTWIIWCVKWAVS